MNVRTPPRRTVVLALVAGGASAVPALAPAPVGASAGCAGASAAATVQAVPVATRAIRCLVNVQRRRHGVPALRPAATLRRVATRHSRAMLRTGRFSHRVPGETTLSRRIRASGYLAGAGRWHYGEALAWTRNPRTTPSALVARLMRSPTHRRTLLDARFREIGVGLVRGVPRHGGSRRRGSTLTLDVGRAVR